MLDFFAGSSTTAHAVFNQNIKDNGNRKFIIVQLPETLDEKSKPIKMDIKIYVTSEKNESGKLQTS